jgi:hypothetical protein
MRFEIPGKDKQGDIRLTIEVENPFDVPGTWATGSLHSHVRGLGEPAAVCERYRERGFSFVAGTDYLHITHPGDTDPAFVFLPGAEMFYPGQTDLTHVLCIGFQDDLKPLNGTPEDVERLVRDTEEQGGIAILAHPFWSGYSWEELMDICGMGIHALEITNRACWAINGKSCSEELWHMLLDRGKRLPVTGGDDAHDPADDRVFGRSWTGVLTEELSVRGILEAIRAGRSYASEGPCFRSIRFERRGAIVVRCSPCVACHVRSRGFGVRSAVADAETEVFEIDLRADGYRMQDWLSVCLEDSHGRRAWSSALLVQVEIDRC